MLVYANMDAGNLDNVSAFDMDVCGEVGASSPSSEEAASSCSQCGCACNGVGKKYKRKKAKKSEEPKVKRVLSQAQQDSLSKARAARNANIARRKEEAAAEAKLAEDAAKEGLVPIVRDARAARDNYIRERALEDVEIALAIDGTAGF